MTSRGHDGDAATLFSSWRLDSLQGRLLWSMVLVLVLALGGLGVRAVSDASVRLQQEETARARALARSVALTLVNPLLTQQLDQVEEALLRMALLPGLRDLRVTDDHGRIISQVTVPEGREPQVEFARGAPLAVPARPSPVVMEEAQGDGRAVLVAWHPIGDHRPVGWVQAVHTLDELASLQREVLLRTLVAAVLAAVLGSLCLMALLRGPLTALRHASRFALKLRQADGALLVVDPRAPHETRTLVESLNSTAVTLAEQARAIELALSTARVHSEALDQRNREMAAILSISPNGLLALDAQDRVQFVSAAFGRMTGLDPQWLIGQPLVALERLLRERCGVADTWPGFVAAFAARGGASDQAPLLALQRPATCELRLERGRVDTAGIAWLISAQDVTREREVERLKSEFLSTAAHELRTPMVSIHGFTELLLRRQQDPERLRGMLEVVYRNSSLMNQIINELLDLSRIEARRGADFDRVLLDLGGLVRAAVADFRPPEGRAAPLVTGPTALPAVGDDAKLRRVLYNLLSNAFKYSRPNAGPVSVTLLSEIDEAGSAAGRVGFCVSDHGIGMTPEQTARVFERFYRADPSGTILGTGLGMSIVREIVELHGGEVHVASAFGEGTAVTVWLPRPTAAVNDSTVPAVDTTGPLVPA